MTRYPTSSDRLWPAWRLYLLLATAIVTALALLAGVPLAIRYALNATPPMPPLPSGQTDAGVRGDAYRDQVAAAPMLAVPPSAATTPTVGAALGPTMSLPAASTIGQAGVPSGFPHTPEGAVAQLAAIEVTVVEAMSIPTAHQVHAAWSVPGGSTAAEWAMTRNVQSFLTTAGGQNHTMDDTILVAAAPAAAQVKGTDGPDWVLACVLLDVRAVIITDARIGYGHCERMTWHDDRWLIGPGTPPAKAPSVWPGSDLAVQAGWHTIQEG